MVKDAEMASVRVRFCPIHLVRLSQEMISLKVRLAGRICIQRRAGPIAKSLNICVHDSPPGQNLNECNGDLTTFKAETGGLQASLYLFRLKFFTEKNP